MRTTIGVDLGHCNTTAAMPYAAKGGYTVRRLDCDVQEKVIYTQLTLSNSQMEKLKSTPNVNGRRWPTRALLRSLGEIAIGDNLALGPGEEGETFRYFKVPPKNFETPCGNSQKAREAGLTHGMLMACFAYALVENLCKQNPDHLPPLAGAPEGDPFAKAIGDLDLLIGCPSTEDWVSPEARKIYAGLINTAVEAHQVRIVPESRAAMFSTVETTKSRVSAQHGALVFDFGSSTADCTYMLMGRKLLEFSWTLGASRIEWLMVSDAFKRLLKDGPVNIDMASFVSSEATMRKVKEEYYSGKYGAREQGVFCALDGLEGEAYNVPLMVGDKLMDRLTKEEMVQVSCNSTTPRSGSWQGLCRDFMEDVRDQVQRAAYTVADGKGGSRQEYCTIKNVVLTGGASRMPFIREICKEVFPQAVIRLEENPSHTVSTGLAWVAVSDENLADCTKLAREAVLDKFPLYSTNLAVSSYLAGLIAKTPVDALKTRMCKALFRQVCTIAEQQATAWSKFPDGAENTPAGIKTSVGNLKYMVEEEMGREENQALFRGLCQRELNTWREQITARVETAVNDQVKRLYSADVANGLLIPDKLWDELNVAALSLSHIDVGQVVNNIDLTGILRKIGTMVIQAAIWVACSWFGPFGWVVGGVLSLFTAIAFTDVDMDKPRSQGKRGTIAKKLRKKLEDEEATVMKDFRESLESQIGDFDAMLDQTLQKAFEIVMLQRFD